jgi:hypothetical protein
MAWLRQIVQWCAGKVRRQMAALAASVAYWRLPARTDRLRAGLLQARPVLFFVTSGARVDTGGWGWQERLSLALVGAEELLLLAPGRHPYVRWLRRQDVTRSFYNAVTGELVLAPAEGVHSHTLRMSPMDGYTVLHWVQHGQTER